MYKIIVKLIKMYKVINFTSTGALEIKYNNSSFVLTKAGDIIINAKRHIIYNRSLSFDGCEQDFIDRTIKANEEGKLEDRLQKEYLDLQLQAEVQKCRSQQ